MVRERLTDRLRQGRIARDSGHATCSDSPPTWVKMTTCRSLNPIVPLPCPCWRCIGRTPKPRHIRLVVVPRSSSQSASLVRRCRSMLAADHWNETTCLEWSYSAVVPPGRMRRAGTDKRRAARSLAGTRRGVRIDSMYLCLSPLQPPRAYPLICSSGDTSRAQAISSLVTTISHPHLSSYRSHTLF